MLALGVLNVSDQDAWFTCYPWRKFNKSRNNFVSIRTYVHALIFWIWFYPLASSYFSWNLTFFADQLMLFLPQGYDVSLNWQCYINRKVVCYRLICRLIHFQNSRPVYLEDYLSLAPIHGRYYRKYSRNDRRKNGTSQRLISIPAQSPFKLIKLFI